jgi:hypothetical protein
MKSGDLIVFSDNKDICLVVEIYKEFQNGSFIDFGEIQCERIVKYLHPKSGFLERTFVEYNGILYVGMHSVKILNR